MLFDRFKKAQHSKSEEVAEQIEEYTPPTAMEALPIVADLKKRQFTERTIAELKKNKPDITKRKTSVWL